MKYDIWREDQDAAVSGLFEYWGVFDGPKGIYPAAGAWAEENGFVPEDRILILPRSKKRSAAMVGMRTELVME